jgi:hypothetical protein
VRLSRRVHADGSHIRADCVHSNGIWRAIACSSMRAAARFNLQESTMLKVITSGIAALALLSLPVSASAGLADELMGDYYAMCGCEPPPPPEEPEKGNNGWGNGADPSNPGSDHGATGPSKNNNNNLPPGQDKVNTNPTDSDGR